MSGKFQPVIMVITLYICTWTIKNFKENNLNIFFRNKKVVLVSIN